MCSVQLEFFESLILQDLASEEEQHHTMLDEGKDEEKKDMGS